MEYLQKLAQEYFPNAKIIADRFHYARYIVNCVDTIRKEVQSKLPKENRSEFMHSRKVLLSRKCNLKKEQLEILNNILINYSENLRIAYYEKERLLDIIHSDCSKTNKIERFNQWVKDNLDSDIPSLKDCAKTYFNWVKEIRNSLECKYNNGIMEGHNNKIKVLKRTAFGFRNFDNFKARILLLD